MALNISLDDIQSRVAAVVDRDEATANISTTDYSLRRMYINMAQHEWAEVWDWKSLYRENNSRISTSTGNASVALPADFRKLAAFPRITYDGSVTEFFPEIRPHEKSLYANTAKYVEILGDQNTGHVMFINAGTLASGASVMTPYYRSPASLVSPANVAMCPNPEYLAQRTLAYIWEANSDPRFQQAKVEAEKTLKRMIETEETYGESYVDEIKTAERKHFGFRWGRDG